MIELQDCQNSNSLVSSSAIFKENYNLEPKNTKYTDIFLSRSNSSLELKDHIDKYNKKVTSPLFPKKNQLCNHDLNQKQKDISTNYSESFQIIREQFENSSSTTTINKNDSNKNEISSPKLRLKFNRFWKQNNLFDESLSSADLMSSSITSANMTNSSYLNVHVNNTPIVSVSADMEERQRRRAFCHYDCQSLTANLSYAAKLRGVLLARRRNTTTGASAASIVLPNVRSNSPETDNQCLEDYGDGLSNDLVENCPYFRNEIGGEEERVVSLTRVHSSNKQPMDFYGKKFVHKPPLAYGMSILEYSSGETHWRHATCPYQRLPLPIENTDRGALYYRHYFYGQEHTNWFGIDEQLGPVAISVKREKLNTSIDNNQNIHNYQYQYRLIIRTSELATLRGAILEDAIPNLRQSHSNHGSNSQKVAYAKEILEFIAPEVQLNCLKLGMHTQQTEDQILKLDEQGLTNQYKVGVMYCKSGQSTEEEMYNNEESGPAFLEFLDTIGQRVRLKGFDKYKAGLDTKTDSTGLYSIYAQYQDCEIMFHVSTLLPFTPNNRQQLLRKRHIGNDIVTIVFQESGSLPFTPKSIRSHFQHVFIIVRAINPCTENTHYSVAVSRSKEVPVFGPPIKEGAIFPKSKTFADFLLAKVINAENATHQSEKFVTMATRTRHEYLKDLALHFSTNTVLDFGQKFSIFSSKKKEKIRPPFISDNIQKGAICWQVILDDSGQSTMVECFLGISSDTLVLIEECSRQIVFVTPCKAILGWYALTNSLRIYHHQGECCTIHMRDSSADRDELMEIIDRFKAVTKGCAVQELSLKRNFMGQLGFHVQPDGIVTQVENTGQAWQAGLRAGARIVEICKIAVSTLTHDQMVDLLKTSLLVTITVVPPLSGSNTPRRGCTLHNCMFNSSFDNDYDLNQNSLETTNETSSIVDKKSAQLQQPVVNKNRKQLCERGFSPPRSSSSSGYGTGNSNKSFHSHVPIHGIHQNQQFSNSITDSRSNQINNDGTMTSSSSDHSSDDRWYDILESHTELMANSTNDLTNTILPPTDSLVTSSYLHQKQSMSSKNIESLNNSGIQSNGKFSKSQNSHSIGVNDTQTKLLTKTISSSNTPIKHNHNEVKLRMNSNSNRIIGGNVSNRNSTNISINNTIQEDLRKLINPENNNDINTTTKLKDMTISSTAQFSPLAHSSSTGNLLNTFSKSALIANRCRSRDALNIALSLNNQSSLSTKRSLSNFASDDLNFDTANDSLWSSNDIISLTKKPSFSQTTDLTINTAIVSSSQSNQREFFESLPPDSSITSFNSNTSVPELQNHLTELESRVNMETKRRLSLENEVKRLRDENRRLQDESQTAAHQLRKFTEWFFQTIDRQ